MLQGRAALILVWRVRCDKHKMKKSPALPGFLTNIFFNHFIRGSFRQFCDLMREPRDLPARIVLVNDVALRCLHQFRFRAGHRL
jgi:hypothetical protein